MLENLDKVTPAIFAGEQPPLQPDAECMLDTVYRAVDISKKTDNYHRIVELSSGGGEII